MAQPHSPGGLLRRSSISPAAVQRRRLSTSSPSLPIRASVGGSTDDNQQRSVNQVKVFLRVRLELEREQEAWQVCHKEELKLGKKPPPRRGISVGQRDGSIQYHGPGGVQESEAGNIGKVFWSMSPEQTRNTAVLEKADLPPFADQATVYEEVGRPCLDWLLQGYNACIMVYGQTGTGKTYTMTGGGGEERGLNPRMMESLFQQLDKNCVVDVSYCEIYLEVLYDLIQGRKEIARKGKLFTCSPTRQQVDSAEEMLSLLEKCQRRRSTAETAMNDASSRSHAILTVYLQQMSDGPERKVDRESRLMLVDLAGSERQRDTHSQGQQFAEAQNINLSLLTLGLVVGALNEGKPPPYRDSMLTHYTQDCLGGNSCTALIGTLSPSWLDLEQSKGTVKFLSRAGTIINPVVKNSSNAEQLIKNLEWKCRDLARGLQQVKQEKEEIEVCHNQIFDALQHKYRELQVRHENLQSVHDRDRRKKAVSQERDAEVQPVPSLRKAKTMRRKLESERRSETDSAPSPHSSPAPLMPEPIFSYEQAESVSGREKPEKPRSRRGSVGALAKKEDELVKKDEKIKELQAKIADVRVQAIRGSAPRDAKAKKDASEIEALRSKLEGVNAALRDKDQAQLADAAKLKKLEHDLREKDSAARSLDLQVRSLEERLGSLRQEYQNAVSRREADAIAAKREQDELRLKMARMGAEQDALQRSFDSRPTVDQDDLRRKEEEFKSLEALLKQTQEDASQHQERLRREVEMLTERTLSIPELERLRQDAEKQRDEARAATEVASKEQQQLRREIEVLTERRSEEASNEQQLRKEIEVLTERTLAIPELERLRQNAEKGQQEHERLRQVAVKERDEARAATEAAQENVASARSDLARFQEEAGQRQLESMQELQRETQHFQELTAGLERRLGESSAELDETKQERAKLQAAARNSRSMLKDELEQKQEALNLSAKLQAELETLRSEHRRQQEALETLGSEHRRQQETQEEAQAALAARGADVETLGAELRAVKADLQHARTEEESAREAARAEREAMALEMDAVFVKLQAAKAELQETREREVAAVSELDTVRGKLQGAEEQLQQARQQERSAIESACKEGKAKAEELDVAWSKLRAAEEQLECTEQREAAAAAQLEVASGGLREAEEELKRAKETEESLRVEGEARASELEAALLKLQGVEAELQHARTEEESAREAA
eukprot:Hpha_TRINITY_DN16963_c2_g3::TRINITY_DN16963_c2_g3_i1::g.55548::m.55548